MRHHLKKWRRAAKYAAIAGVILTLAPAGCSGGAAYGGKAEITVVAATSLSEAFSEIAAAFEAAHPGSSVRLNFSGSQRLRTQLEHGAKADIFASADQIQMDLAIAAELVAGEAVEFASNRMVVIVPMRDKKRQEESESATRSSGFSGGKETVRSLHDLGRPGVKLVLALPEVPAGAYARTVIERLSEEPNLGPDYARRVLANVVSEEVNVRSVAQKVALDEADAGIVYLSDTKVPQVAGSVKVIPLRDDVNVVASYPIARLRDSARPDLADLFISFATSVDGQAILGHHGFGTAGRTPSSSNRIVPPGAEPRAGTQTILSTFLITSFGVLR